MQKKIITIGGCNIAFNNISSVCNAIEIDFSKSFESQKDFLYEDLQQIRFCNGNILDVGWYPECEISGKFTVVLLENEMQWDLPVIKEYATDKESLILELKNT